MGETKVYSLTIGNSVDVCNEGGKPWLVKIDSGPYGTVELTVPMGGKFRITAAERAPRISFHDVDGAAIEGPNIIPFKRK